MDTQTLYEKLSAVPPAIRTHFGSDGVIAAAEIINQHFKIPDNRKYILSSLLQRLQIKDIDAEYFAGELSIELNLDKNNALAITVEIKRTILAPLRKELLDYGIDISFLDKFQIPIIKPKIIQEIKPPMPGAGSSRSSPVGTAINPMMIAENFKVMPVTPLAMPKPPMPMPAPLAAQAAPAPTAPAWKPQQVTSQTAAGLNVSTTPLASNRNTPGQAPTPPAPAKPPADKGWSRQSPQDPVVKLGVITPSVPAPTASTPTSAAQQVRPPSTPVPPAQIQKSSGEFARLDMMKKAPAAAAAVPIPPPVMLHQVSPSSVQQSPEFRINMGIQNQINKVSAPPPMPNRPAVIEFGGGMATPKAVNYSDPKASAPTPSVSPTGPRNITEITSAPAMPSSPRPSQQPQPAQPVQPTPAPLPTMPPKPPAPALPQSQSSQPPRPQPTQPVQPSQNTKTIVKDFL